MIVEDKILNAGIIQEKIKSLGFDELWDYSNIILNNTLDIRHRLDAERRLTMLQDNLEEAIKTYKKAMSFEDYEIAQDHHNLIIFILVAYKVNYNMSYITTEEFNYIKEIIKSKNWHYLGYYVNTLNVIEIKENFNEEVFIYFELYNTNYKLDDWYNFD